MVELSLSMQEIEHVNDIATHKGTMPTFTHILLWHNSKMGKAKEEV